MREFVDEELKTFFARIEFEGLISDNEVLKSLLQQSLPEDALITVNPKQQKRIVVLVSKEYHCLGDILVKHFFNTLNAEVCSVIGNHDQLEPFTKKFESRSIIYHTRTKQEILVRINF